MHKPCIAIRYGVPLCARATSNKARNLKFETLKIWRQWDRLDNYGNESNFFQLFFNSVFWHDILIRCLSVRINANVHTLIDLERPLKIVSVVDSRNGFESIGSLELSRWKCTDFYYTDRRDNWILEFWLCSTVARARFASSHACVTTIQRRDTRGQTGGGKCYKWCTLYAGVVAYWTDTRYTRFKDLSVLRNRPRSLCLFPSPTHTYTRIHNATHFHARPR